MKKHVIIEEKDGFVNYLIPSGADLKLDVNTIAKYKNNTFTNFDDLVKVQQSLWMLNEFKGEWMSSTCSCPFFFKNYNCKHSVGMAIRQGLLKPPPEAKTVAMGQKRKRGRPSKAQKALLIQ